MGGTVSRRSASVCLALSGSTPRGRPLGDRYSLLPKVGKSKRDAKSGGDGVWYGVSGYLCGMVRLSELASSVVVGGGDCNSYAMGM